MRNYLMRDLRLIFALAACMSIISASAFGSVSQDTALFFQFEHSPQDPYIHQQVIYTVKLFQRVPFFNGTYSTPHLDDALFFPLGESNEYHATFNGEMYTVAEQRYAVFPQKSGILPVYGPALDAVVHGVTPTKLHLGAGLSTLHVKPQPVSPSHDWLPAKNVRIKVQDDISSAQVKLGQVIVRNIILTADEIPAELLPNLYFKHTLYWDVYAEKPAYSNSLHKHRLHGQAKYRVSYIFNHPGHVSLPKQDIYWFNTNSGAFEIASIPARNIFVLGGHVVVPKTPHKEIINTHVSVYAWCMLAFMLIGSCWMLKGCSSKRRNKKVARSYLHQACIKQQPVQISKALIAWAQIYFSDDELVTLHDLIDRIHNAEFKHQLQLLLEALYKYDGRQSWNGQTLWRCVLSINQAHKKSNTKKSLLPPINHG